MMLEPLEEVGANFSLQLPSQTQFTKINNKKVIAKNQCEKHKKSRFFFFFFFFFFFNIGHCAASLLVNCFCFQELL